MSLIVVLILLLFLFGGGGLSYGTWGASGPAWGGGVLYALAFIVLVVLILNAAGLR